jgi:hypothetical protein
VVAGGAGGQGDAKGGAGGGGATTSDAARGTDQASGSGEARAEQVCRDAILAQCDRRTVCAGLSYDECAGYADRCPDYYFGSHSLRTVENVEACVPILRQVTCTDYALGLGADCLAGGPGAGGAPCSSSSECASGICSVALSACGTCRAPGQVGDSCIVGLPCAQGVLCHPATGTCVAVPAVLPHASAGQACDLGASPPMGCEGDLICVPTTSNGTAGTCTPLPTQGEKCFQLTHVASCAPGFACGIDRSDGLRTARCGNPAPCGTTVCDSTSFCYETPDVFNVCRLYSVAGEPCSNANYRERRCADGTICLTTTGDAGDQGTCATVVEVGAGEACSATAACKIPYYCSAGHCAKFDPASCYQPPDAGP